MSPDNKCNGYENQIRNSLIQSHVVYVTDVSDGHVKQGVLDGRAQNAAGIEIIAIVVSDDFKGKSILERHRIVNDALAEDLKSGLIHAIQIRTWTADQWEKRGRPDCSQGRTCTSLLKDPVIALPISA